MNVVTILLLPFMLVFAPASLLLLIGRRKFVRFPLIKSASLTLFIMLAGLLTPIVACYACGFAINLISVTPESYYYNELTNGASVFFPIGYSFSVVTAFTVIYYYISRFKMEMAQV